jgi:hypothetical protein
MDSAVGTPAASFRADQAQLEIPFYFNTKYFMALMNE